MANVFSLVEPARVVPPMPTISGENAWADDSLTALTHGPLLHLFDHRSKFVQACRPIAKYE
jgi:hypothetical protein